MLSFTQPLKGMAEFEEIEKSLEKNQGIVQITGCLESQKAHLIHGLSGKAPLRLVIAGDERQAKETYQKVIELFPKPSRTCAFIIRIPCFIRRRIFCFSRQILREIC